MIWQSLIGPRLARHSQLDWRFGLAFFLMNFNNINKLRLDLSPIILFTLLGSRYVILSTPNETLYVSELYMYGKCYHFETLQYYDNYV